MKTCVLGRVCGERERECKLFCHVGRELFLTLDPLFSFHPPLCLPCVMCVLDSPFSLSLFGQHSALSWCVVSHVVFLFLFVLLLFINAACTYSVEALRLQRTCRLYTTSSLFLLLSLSLSDNISFLLCLSQNTHLLKFSVSLPNLCTPAALTVAVQQLKW